MEFSRQVTEALNFQKWLRTDWEWPQLQAHRGYWIEGAMENSLSALAKAKEKSFEMAEIDVRLSEDGVAVLYHDRNLKRLAKKNLRVNDLTVRELEKYGIPTLYDVLQARQRPAKLNIEIKKEDRWDYELEKAVAVAIRDAKKEKEVLISSFNPLSLKKFSEQLPEVPRALLIELDEWKWISYLRLSGNFLSRAHMVNWPYKLLTPEIIDFLKKAKVPIATWTVNDYRLATDLLSRGVDSVITDRVVPDLLT